MLKKSIPIIFNCCLENVRAGKQTKTVPWQYSTTKAQNHR
jgi:hypothetical protein